MQSCGSSHRTRSWEQSQALEHGGLVGSVAALNPGNTLQPLVEAGPKRPASGRRLATDLFPDAAMHVVWTLFRHSSCLCRAGHTGQIVMPCLKHEYGQTADAELARGQQPTGNQVRSDPAPCRQEQDWDMPCTCPSDPALLAFPLGAPPHKAAAVPPPHRSPALCCRASLQPRQAPAQTHLHAPSTPLSL